MGKWKVFERTTKRKIADVTYDDNGNYIKVYLYRDGKLFTHFTSPPCNKKKFVKHNLDGSVYGEQCIDYKIEFGFK